MWSVIFIMWFYHYVMWFYHYVMWFCLYVVLVSLPIPSSSTQALLAITNWLSRFLDGFQFLLFLGVKDNKMAGTSKDILSSILDKMHLGHVIETFEREKVTVDQICKLSGEEMEH